MAVPWPTLADLETQLQTTFAGDKATVAVVALEAAKEWVTERLGVGPASVQEVLLSGAPTGGTFILTLDGLDTVPVAYNASAATVQAALETLANVGAGNVSVTGRPGSLYTITFAGELVGQDVPFLTATSYLAGGYRPTVAARSLVRGAATIPAPVHQAILLYAAKFYRRKDTPDGVAGTAENGLFRTGRYDSDAESLLRPYVPLIVL